MPLTDSAIEKTKPEVKQRRLHDERGLFLKISPKGGSWWRFEYLFDVKGKLPSLNTYMPILQGEECVDENHDGNAVPH